MHFKVLYYLCVSSWKLINNDLHLFHLHRSRQGFSEISQLWHTAFLMCPSYFICEHKYQQIYKIMGCFYTDKLSESGTKNGWVTHVWGGGLLVQERFCRANMITVADTRRFVASRGAKRSGIVMSLWHIWLPAAPLRQLASSYTHACKSIPALHDMHAWWIPNRVLGNSYFSWFFSVRGSTRINCTPVLFTGTGTAEFAGFRVHILGWQHR